MKQTYLLWSQVLSHMNEGQFLDITLLFSNREIEAFTMAFTIE